MTRVTFCVACISTLLVCFPARPQAVGTPPLPINPGSLFPSNPLPPIITPDTTGLLQGIVPSDPYPVDMKLLILGTDGTEPGLAALKYLLDYLGTPYQVVLLAAGQSLPPLNDGIKGFYQGIILTIGNLGICNPTCHSALSLDGWVKLDSYARNYRVRVVSYYTFPEARYGLAPVSAIGTTDQAPGMVNLTPAGAGIFNYLRPTAPVKVMWSWTYLAAAVAAPGETTTPILQLGNAVVGVTHTLPDGREYMALTMDNNPYLFHSAILHYGIVHWVTKGIFLGSPKTYMTPQVDDHFLSNDLFYSPKAACIPVGFAADPTFDPGNQCPTYRITGQDLATLGDWQQNIRANPQFAQFQISMAFNGIGATQAGGTLPGDSLVSMTQSRA